MLRATIVGCGKIADAHAAAILRVGGCELVGVCDRELLMARQLSERFPIKACFDDLTELLRQTQPDVVNITTPPASHFEIARLCLEHYPQSFSVHNSILPFEFSIALTGEPVHPQSRFDIRFNNAAATTRVASKLIENAKRNVDILPISNEATVVPCSAFTAVRIN